MNESEKYWDAIAAAWLRGRGWAVMPPDAEEPPEPERVPWTQEDIDEITEAAHATGQRALREIDGIANPPRRKLRFHGVPGMKSSRPNRFYIIEPQTGRQVGGYVVGPWIDFGQPDPNAWYDVYAAIPPDGKRSNAEKEVVKGIGIHEGGHPYTGYDHNPRYDPIYNWSGLG